MKRTWNMPARPAGAAAAVLVALSLAACSEGLLRESAPLPPAQLGIVASFSDGAGGGADQAYAQVNRLHVRFSSGGATRFEQTLPFDGTASQSAVPVEVDLKEPTETFLLDVELRRDADPIFRGSAQLTLSTGAANSVEIALQAVLARVACTGTAVLLDALGATQQLSAAALFATGDTINGVPIQWTSQNVAIAIVNAAGVVQAVTEGETTVQCSAGGQTDARAIRVAATASAVTVVPAQVTVDRGSTQPLAAEVRDRLGNLLAGRAVTWTSSAPGVASVDAAGMVTGLAAGTARIDATSGSATGSATITVRNRAPSAVTGAAQLNAQGAALAGTVNPHGLATEAWFEYGTAPTLAGAASTPATSIAGGDAAVPVSAAITQLTPGATYFYRVAARNSVGTARGSIEQLRAPLVVTVTPAEASTTIGGQFRFTAAVLGSTNTAVTWESSNPAVATVDAQGVATGRGLGSATITATSVADPTRSASAVLTVTRVATLNLVSISSAGGASPSAVSGVATVRLTADAAAELGVRAVVVTLGGTEVCRETFAQPLDGSTTLDCTFDTGAADENGVPRFTNGARALAAFATDGAGEQIGATETCAFAGSPCTVVLANQNTVRVTVDGAGDSSVDDQGRTWWRSFTATVTPIVYTAGQHATQVVVTAAHADGQVSRTIGPVSGPTRHVVTFTPAALGGIESRVQVSAQASTAAGASFGSPQPAADDPVFAFIDNRAPSLLEVVAPAHDTFVGSAFQFAASAADGGVGIGAGEVSFDIVSSTAPSGGAVPGGSGVTSVAGVAETASSRAYALRIVASDRLGNTGVAYAHVEGFGESTSIEALSLFGVERTPPVLTVLQGPEDLSTSGPETSWYYWLLQATDPAGSVGASGINPDSVRARLVWYSATYPAGVCVDPNEGFSVIISTSSASPACFVSIPPVQSTVVRHDFEDEAAGYYVLTAYAVDNAGNRSATLTRTVLDDYVAPEVQSIVAPAAIVGNATFQVRSSDNVDLGDLEGGIGFADIDEGPGIVLLQQRVALSAYGLPLVSAANTSYAVPSFIRSLSRLFRDVQATTTASFMEFIVRDQAQVQLGVECGAFYYEIGCGRDSVSIQAAVEAGLGGGSFRDWTQLVVADPNLAFFASVQYSGDMRTATITARLQGVPPLANPFQRLEFYARNQWNEEVHARSLGVGAASVTDGDGMRTWSFTRNISASDLSNGYYEVLPIGVDASGDGLLTAPVYLYVDDGEFIFEPGFAAARRAEPRRSSLWDTSRSRQ